MDEITVMFDENEEHPAVMEGFSQWSKIINHEKSDTQVKFEKEILNKLHEIDMANKLDKLGLGDKITDDILKKDNNE